MDIKDIIEFWNNNYYSQSLCLLNMIELINDMVVPVEIAILKQDAIIVLQALSNNIVVKNKIKIFNTINFFESLFIDNDVLCSIACILSGEYLTDSFDNLVNILEYHKWSIPCDKNIFICWYYDLNNDTEYFNFINKVYKNKHLVAILQFIAISVLDIILIMSIESFMNFMSYTYLSNIPGLLVISIQYIVLLLMLIGMAVLLSNFNYYYLLKSRPRFHNYIIRRNL